MARFYACIISEYAKRDAAVLMAVASEFSYRIEVLEDGILFDVSGLERLMGKPEKIAGRISSSLKRADRPGSIAVAANAESAILLARQRGESAQVVHSPDGFERLALSRLNIDKDTLGIFADLGLRRVEDLLAVPEAELVSRYGREFQSVIRTMRQSSDRLVVPNIKESSVSWRYELDHAVEDFEQLIFILNHGLESLFKQIDSNGLSTEFLDISFKLANRSGRSYEIKTSFPTLDRSFWLKLINLRISLDPPEAAISSMHVCAHFTKPRPDQRGLYAVSRPKPESLLLTVNKLKKLVGETEVGIPVIRNQREYEAFELDAERLPTGTEKRLAGQNRPLIGFNYFRPPLRAEVEISDNRLLSVKTRLFSGYVAEYSGVWRGNSRWWDKPWKTHEWDVEIENNGVYKLCRTRGEWFVLGEYD